MEQYKGVIFDLDGTLVDSMWMWHAIDIEFLNSRGIDVPENLQSEIEGKSFTETAIYFKNRFSLQNSIEEIKDIWNKMSYDKYKNEVQLKPYAYEFLEKLRSMGMKLAIATSNSKALTQCILEARKISHFFDAVVTGCDVSHGKPDPEIYLKASNQIGINPADCAVFEDVTQGIIAAKRAGMTVYAVEEKASEMSRDEKIRLADYYIKDYSELI